MANVGTGASGKTLIGAGNGASPTYASIGTNSGLLQFGVVVAEGNGAFQATNPGSTGQILMANSGANPSFQSGGTVVGQTITGNTGGALSPTAGNWNILGSHGLNTAGSGSTLTAAINNAITLGDLSALGAGVGALTATTGDIIISAGNMRLPTTASANAGVLQINATRFMHAFGINNTFLGTSSGNFTLTGQAAVGVGTSALTALTSGLRNTAVGNASMIGVTTGGDNTAVGDESLVAACTDFNVAVGSFALNKYTGGGNTAVGQAALGNTVSGDHDTAVGFNALTLTTGASNTGIGYQAFPVLSTGTRNTGIGDAVGFNLLTGADNIFIGKNAAISYTGAESSNIVIGTSGTVGESNVIRLGEQGTGAAQQTQTYIAGVINTVSGRVVKITTPGAYPYTTLTTDYVILVDSSSARTITPLGSPVTGTTYRIKDNVGSAGTNNITITPSGKNIDGAASYVIAVNYGSADIVYNGTQWDVL
jgi:hypothetical protein